MNNGLASFCMHLVIPGEHISASFDDDILTDPAVSDDEYADLPDTIFDSILDHYAAGLHPSEYAFALYYHGIFVLSHNEDAVSCILHT